MNPLLSLYQAMQNPNQFLDRMMGNKNVMNNGMAKNALQMMKSGDGKGIEQMARNMCKERGINPDDAVNQLRQQLGIK